MSKKENDNFKEILERVQETLVKAEQNVARTFRELGERLADTQVEAKKRVDELVAALSSKERELVDRMSLDSAFERVNAMREEFESKASESRGLFWEKLGVATKADVAELNKKLTQIQRRLKELGGDNKKPRARSEA